MNEDVRKPMTFLAVVFIFLAVGLGWDKVKAFQIFGADFAEGKDRGHIEAKIEGQTLVYKIQGGDTWGKVARDHGISTRALLEANDANVGTELVPGRNILLPGAPVTAPAASGGAGSR